MAQILSFPQSNENDSPVDQEVKRRVYWTLYMVDRWSSAGLGLTRQLPDALKYPMPVHELDFHQQFFEYYPNQKRGLWAYFIDLAYIFGEIQDLHSRHVNGELEDAHFEEQAQALAAMLERFAETLPAELHLNVENLQWHAERGIGRTFVALHLGYHHYCSLVHFQYLDIQLPRTPKQRLFASRCKHHANTFSDLLKLSTEIPNCDAVYNIVGHMTVVSSSVLLYTLFFGDEDELPTTRQRLEHNFQVLIKLRGYWPSVSDMVGSRQVCIASMLKLTRYLRQMDRLFTFQKVCMWSADPNTHKIDKWMLKFLLQHALPVEDKTDSRRASLPAHATSPTVWPAFAEISSERDQYATSALSMLRQ
ncbi:Transcription factor fungi [Macrophomina phaseolina MS6]|uniref:Transcription factor fungi n=1 Tax=Macrophomina phaseolina (strain MS6) TaxID=1126212 RepID=K2RXN4_MACPH|nr:Transcription factor fungi [Macrophomina phaseolina MS6]